MMIQFQSGSTASTTSDFTLAGSNVHAKMTANLINGVYTIEMNAQLRGVPGDNTEVPGVQPTPPRKDSPASNPPAVATCRPETSESKPLEKSTSEKAAEYTGYVAWALSPFTLPATGYAVYMAIKHGHLNCCLCPCLRKKQGKSKQDKTGTPANTGSDNPPEIIVNSPKQGMVSTAVKVGLDGLNKATGNHVPDALIDAAANGAAGVAEKPSKKGLAQTVVKEGIKGINKEDNATDGIIWEGTTKGKKEFAEHQDRKKKSNLPENMPKPNVVPESATAGLQVAEANTAVTPTPPCLKTSATILTWRFIATVLDEPLLIVNSNQADRGLFVIVLKRVQQRGNIHYYKCISCAGWSNQTGIGRVVYNAETKTAWVTKESLSVLTLERHRCVYAVPLESTSVSHKVAIRRFKRSGRDLVLPGIEITLDITPSFSPSNSLFSHIMAGLLPFAPLVNPSFKCTLTVAAQLLSRLPHVRTYYQKLKPTTTFDRAFKRIVLSCESSTSSAISIDELSSAAGLDDLFTSGGSQTYRVLLRLLEFFPKQLQQLFETKANVVLNCGCNHAETRELNFLVPFVKSKSGLTKFLEECNKRSSQYERQLSVYHCIDCYVRCNKEGVLGTILNGTHVPACAVSSGKATLHFVNAPCYLLLFNFKWPAYKTLEFNANSALIRFEGRTWDFVGGGRVTAWSEGNTGHVEAVVGHGGSFYLIDDKAPSASKISPVLNLADFDVFVFAQRP